ncbi:hypothetical protein JCM3770_000592 [Rhodotorula araucariae]
MSCTDTQPAVDALEFDQHASTLPSRLDSSDRSTSLRRPFPSQPSPNTTISTEGTSCDAADSSALDVSSKAKNRARSVSERRIDDAHSPTAFPYIYVPAHAPCPPSRGLPSPFRFDLSGRPLPHAPPPADPFAQALSLGASFPATTAKRHPSMFVRPFQRHRREDTQSSVGWVQTSASGPRGRSLSLDVHLWLAAPQVRSLESVIRPLAPRHSANNAPVASDTAPRTMSGRPHIVVDLPAVPPQTYSPDTPSVPSLAAPSRPVRQATPPPPLHTSPTSPFRPTLASRRSALQLSPLLPASTAPATLSALSRAEASRLPDSPDSPSSHGLPLVTPGAPLPVSTHRKRRECRDTSGAVLPLPLVPHAAAVLEHAEPDRSRTASYEGSSRPHSRKYSLPPCPPPDALPPRLPGFVSVFFDPHAPAASSLNTDDDSWPLPPQTTCPPDSPAPPLGDARRSHVRAMDSISSSIASPRASTLRQRVISPPVEERRTSRMRVARDEEKQVRMDVWISGLTPSRVSGVATDIAPPVDKKGSGVTNRLRWVEKAAPGWSLRSDSLQRRSQRKLSGRWMGPVGDAFRLKKVRIGTTVGVVVVLLLLVGLATGLTRKIPAPAASSAAAACICEHAGSARLTSDGLCYCACRAEWGGTTCHLNATCVEVGDRFVAQGLLDLVDEATRLWHPALSTSRLGSVLKNYFVSSTVSASSSCQSQLAFLVLPNLPPSAYPFRLRWVEAALVHTLALTESNATLTQLRTFALGLSFARFGDAPASKPNSNYQVIAGGWMWDFSVLQRSAPGSWFSIVKPPRDVISRLSVAPAAQGALERLAPVAAAASAQRCKALENYWADTLRRTGDELVALRAAVQGAEIVIPHDATASVRGTATMDLTDLMQLGAGSFPPAIGCWAGLNDGVLERVNAVEVDVFGLGKVSRGQALDTSCLDRPLYGVLNLLQLHLPFPSSDSRGPLPQQSLVLLSDPVASRVTVHAGELLAAGPLVVAASSPSPSPTLEQFGLLSRLDHVLLDILTSVPVSTATDLVNYLLSAPSGPPSASAYPSLLSGALPLVEVQLWGGLRYDDIDLARSSLVVPNGNNLFFGSREGVDFRSWALQSTQRGRVEWVLSAEQADAVLDDGGGNLALEDVWERARNGSLKTAGKVWTALRRAGTVSG